MTTCILVPLDGSPCAEHAVAYAVRVAKADGLSIEFRTFVDPRAVVGRSLSEPLKEEHVAAAMAEARAIVARAVAQASKAGLQASGRAELGEPASEIVRQATELEAHAIVIGAHGQSGFKRLFMGSVAEHVLRSASCPVIIVREKITVERTTPPATLIADSEPICSLRLVEVAPDDFEQLYGEIATFMDGPESEISGVLDAQLLGSVDRTRILILVRFSSRSDWVRAQWDRQFGQLLEEIALSSETLEFDLYFGDRFASKVQQCDNLAPSVA